jgi:hypothetical protein
MAMWVASGSLKDASTTTGAFPETAATAGAAEAAPGEYPGIGATVPDAPPPPPLVHADAESITMAPMNIAIVRFIYGPPFGVRQFGTLGAVFSQLRMYVTSSWIC